jgi:hypothetical protein
MSFFNPWFLVGIAAVAVPIVVHLVRREHAKRVPFPSLMFLRRIPQKSVRRRRLRHLLLLALRCLALLLLALAFARPFIPSDAVSSSGAGRSLVILLDTSYSMQYGNRFRQAQERARSLITDAGPKDRVALMAFSEGYEIVRPLSLDRDAILADLAGLQPTLHATNYVQALRGAASVLSGAADQEKTVALISDFQATGWNRPNDSVTLNAQLMPVDVADGDSPNVACVEVSVEPVVYTSKYDGKLLAKLTNFSNQSQSVRVRFKLNDRLVEEKAIGLGAWASQPVEFAGFNLLDGSNRATIEIEDDPLPLDNHFFFTIEKTERQAVLGLESAPGGSFYLQQALAVSQNNPYALTLQPAGRMALSDLEKARVVILNDVTRLDATVVTQLKRWVEQGGGLLIATGRRVDANAFNQTFGDLAPASLDKSVVPGGGAFELLAQIEATHPIFAPFAEGRSGNFSTARFYGYVQATPKTTARVLARLTGGEAAVIENSLGAGKVLLVTSSLDTSWNDLPLSPLYVPLVHQMLRYVYSVETRGWYRLGETVRVQGARPEAPVPIDSPSEKRLTSGEGLSPDGTLFTARENGFYRLRYPDRERYVAVNVDFRESDLRKLDVDEFIAAFGGESEAQAAIAQIEQEGELLEHREPGRRLWWPLLLSALALFIVEAVLAGRLTPQRHQDTKGH